MSLSPLGFFLRALGLILLVVGRTGASSATGALSGGALLRERNRRHRRTPFAMFCCGGTCRGYYRHLVATPFQPGSDGPLSRAFLRSPCPRTASRATPSRWQ